MKHSTRTQRERRSRMMLVLTCVTLAGWCGHTASAQQESIPPTNTSSGSSAAGTNQSGAASDQDRGPGNVNTPDGSLMSRAFSHRVERSQRFDQRPHALHAVSMFSMEEEPPREFREHDLVQIIVRESSEASSSQETETKKEFDVAGKVNAWPDLRLSDILDLRLNSGAGTMLPEVNVTLEKEFKGEGEYERKDDFSTRLTAEVVTVLPNGNLVLEARTFIKTDEEESRIKVSGICRAEDVTPANTIQSFQIHDLKVEKVHEGELKKSNEKGIITQVLDALFGF